MDRLQERSKTGNVSGSVVESPQRWIESLKIRIIAQLMNLKCMDDTNRRSEKDPTFRRRIIEEFKNSSNN